MGLLDPGGPVEELKLKQPCSQKGRQRSAATGIDLAGLMAERGLNEPHLWIRLAFA